MEDLKIQNLSPITIQPSLQISEKGELRLVGKIPDNIQPILDATQLQSREYRRHQERLSRDSNLMSIYFGVIFSIVVGLIIFSICNVKTQPQAYSNVKSVIS